MIQLTNKNFINNKQESLFQITKKKSDNQPIEKWGKRGCQKFHNRLILSGYQTYSNTVFTVLVVVRGT